MKLFTVVTFLLCLAAHGFASTGGGNGGDFVRMKFISTGHKLLQDRSEQLKKVLPAISIEHFADNLTVNRIRVSQQQLVDNLGNPVDAIGEQGKIELFVGDMNTKTGWYGIFQRMELVELLVLHEMIRSVGVNDDDYVYSKEVLKSYDLQIDARGKINIAWAQMLMNVVKKAVLEAGFAKTYAESATILAQQLKVIHDRIPENFYEYFNHYHRQIQEVDKLGLPDRSRYFFLRSSANVYSQLIRVIEGELVFGKGQITQSRMDVNLFNENLALLKKLILSATDAREELALSNAGLVHMNLILTKLDHSYSNVASKVATCLELNEIIKRRSCVMEVKPIN